MRPYKIILQRLIVHGARGFWIERQIELLVPVEQETRLGERVVTVARIRTMPRYVSGMCRNLVPDHALHYAPARARSSHAERRSSSPL
ncbi:MAG: hypothetical protein WB762_20210 [Candidatus Sulfotelmatobacter sp.]